MAGRLPPLDAIARVLASVGRRGEALAFLDAAVARRDEESARCDALAQQMRARTNEAISAPPLAIDAALVESIAASGRIYEASLVARAADLSQTIQAVELARALDLALRDPSDIVEPLRRAYVGAVRRGSVGELRALLEQPGVDPELDARVQAAMRLLRGFSPTPRSASPESISTLRITRTLRLAVAEKIGSRDLFGALTVAQRSTEPGAEEVRAVLGRLLAAIDKQLGQEQSTGARTVPLRGAPVALFQLKMGNIDVAESTLVSLSAQDPDDTLVPPILRDVRILQQILAEDLDASRSRAGWLDKRSRPLPSSGWSQASKDGAVDVATNVLRPDEEAELHVRAGRIDKAIELFERLARNYPEVEAFPRRLAELRRELGAGETPASGLSRPAIDAAGEGEIEDAASPRVTVPFEGLTTLRARAIAKPVEADAEHAAEPTRAVSLAAIAARAAAEPVTPPTAHQTIDPFGEPTAVRNLDAVERSVIEGGGLAPPSPLEPEGTFVARLDAAAVGYETLMAPPEALALASSPAAVGRGTTEQLPPEEPESIDDGGTIPASPTVVGRVDLAIPPTRTTPVDDDGFDEDETTSVFSPSDAGASGPRPSYASPSQATPSYATPSYASPSQASSSYASPPPNAAPPAASSFGGAPSLAASPERGSSVAYGGQRGGAPEPSGPSTPGSLPNAYAASLVPPLPASPAAPPRRGLPSTAVVLLPVIRVS